MICGNYLAKEGLRTLIVEQHSLVGGCCSAYEREGYRFSAGVKYLGGLRRGTLGTILKELGIASKMQFDQFDPTDRILLPDREIFIRAKPIDTMREWMRHFAKEKAGIRLFFDMLLREDFLGIYIRLKKKTFQQLLDELYADSELKFMLNALVYGNTGLLSHEISAVQAILLFRVYILDPGYYPVGGIQAFPEMLKSSFEARGGKVILSKRVTRVLTGSHGVAGIECEDGSLVVSKIVVSDSDATELFTKLLRRKVSRERKIVRRMVPGNSCFMVFAGVDIDLRAKLKNKCGVYYLPHYRLQSLYDDYTKQCFNIADPNAIMCAFPMIMERSKNAKSSVEFGIQVPYISEEFWKNSRDELAERLTGTLEKHILGFSIRDRVTMRFTAVPDTFRKFTSNRDGALCGWASTRDQLKLSLFPSKTSVRGLYLAGQWATTGFGQGGVTGVANAGRKAASIVLEEAGFGKKYEAIRP